MQLGWVRWLKLKLSFLKYRRIVLITYTVFQHVVGHEKYVLPPVGATEDPFGLRKMSPKGSVLKAHQQCSIEQDESEKRWQKSKVSVGKHSKVHSNALKRASLGLNLLAFGEFHVEKEAAHNKKYLDDQAAVLKY